MCMKKIIFIFCLIACLSAAMIPVACGAISNQGWIQVISNVDGASVYFDNKYQGLTSNGQLVVTVYTAAPVQRSGWKKTDLPLLQEHSPCRMPGATTKAYAILRPVSTPTPSATYGALSVDSSPQGAKIYLNGYYRDISPFSFDQLTPGATRWTLFWTDTSPYSTMVRISAGSTTNVYTALHHIFITKFDICHFRSHECLCLS